jgi:riboflavin kinase/FMN adenylyltransferase
MDGGPWVDSITNIGTRPTFGGGAQTIETFVLQGSVPSETATSRLQFLRRLRDERQFDSPELLREQIGRDVQSAAKFFRRLRLTDDATIHTN